MARTGESVFVLLERVMFTYIVVEWGAEKSGG